MSKVFSHFATAVSHATGKPVTFALCLMAIVVWGLCGPIFHFSDTWQLVINTSTTIITFLQVFLIQNTQNRDGAAIQAKLDELIRASAAQNRFIGIEELTEDELKAIRESCAAKGRVAQADQLAEAADTAEDRANARAQRAAEHVSE